MGLNKATGDMYSWVTHTHTHLRGACPHACDYCYARKGRAQRFYKGPLRLEAKELNVGYGSRDHAPKTIFIEHMSDLFAIGVKFEWIDAILAHCKTVPENTYVFQTKNPGPVGIWIKGDRFPPNFILGATIATNRFFSYSYPPPQASADAMAQIRADLPDAKLFITIEPIMDFDELDLIMMIMKIKPDFVNIGADSKRSGLCEPAADKIFLLIAALEAQGIEVRTKPNLFRLLKDCGRKDITFHFPDKSSMVIAPVYPQTRPGFGSEVIV